MKTLYPAIEPYVTHHLPVEGGHRLYYEECGNPVGLPVLYFHGGPGSGCKPFHRRFFDPEKYRIILLDQRGGGRSTPAGGLEHNTTAHLLSDLEALRKHLGIDRWILFAGSWGAALALLYAEQRPENVLGMIVRGSFLARARDLDWFVADGVSRIYPDHWATFLDHFPPEQRSDPLQAMYQLLTGADEVARLRIARAWTLWSAQVAHGDGFDPAELDQQAPTSLVQQARIEIHYAVHRYFIADHRIVDDLHRIPKVPIHIIHGRLDLVCPAEAAFVLHRNLAGSELKLLPDAGHLPIGDSMTDALVGSTDELAELLA